MITNDELRKYVQEQPLDFACSIIVTEFRQYLLRIQTVFITMEAGLQETTEGHELIKNELAGITGTISELMLGELIPRLRELYPERSHEIE